MAFAMARGDVVRLVRLASIVLGPNFNLYAAKHEYGLVSLETGHPEAAVVKPFDLLVGVARGEVTVFASDVFYNSASELVNVLNALRRRTGLECNIWFEPSLDVLVDALYSIVDAVEYGDGYASVDKHSVMDVLLSFCPQELSGQVARLLLDEYVGDTVDSRATSVYLCLWPGTSITCKGVPISRDPLDVAKAIVDVLALQRRVPGWVRL